jgi:hypothetical protein
VAGDTHFFRIDKALIKATTTLPNLTRVQTFGSSNIHWAVSPSIRPRGTSSRSTR